ncbi:MAG: hypothetical protein HZB92_08110 [Euryarchaeota archaeon]|nr:hypothetical protein [Euryarchaeota archaeon]
MADDETGYKGPSDVLTHRGGVFWGIALLIVGALWLLNEVGILVVPITVILPLLLLLLGIWLLIARRFFWGTVLVFVGTIMLVAAMGYIPVTWGLIIPIVIIIIGIWLLFTRFRGVKRWST